MGLQVFHYRELLQAQRELVLFSLWGSHKGFLVITPLKPELISMTLNLGPDLQNILLQSYDYLTIMPNLRSTCDRRLIQKTSWEGRRAFLGYNSLAKSSEIVFVH